MKMTLQIIGLIILGLTAGFVIKNQNDKKPDMKVIENNILMVDGKPILKQFGDLTISDFDKFSIWVQCHIIDYDERWYDDTNEETFRPWTEKTPVSPDYAMFLIKADLKLKNGAKFQGFLTPCLESDYQNENDLGLIQPQIFGRSGECIGFWTGAFPMKSTEIQDFYKLIGKTPEEIFPIEFKAVEGLAIGVTSGKINGFLAIGENMDIIVTK